jgi:GTP-binding protein
MSALPLVAIVGRTNVGKSTLFNVLTNSRDAIVADTPGVTRDRQYGVCRREGKPGFIVVDTGGLGEPDSDIAAFVVKQARAAIEEAAVLLFVIDAGGLVGEDHTLAQELRRSGKTVVLAVNKIDGRNEDVALGEAAELGFTRAYPIAARERRGIAPLLEAVYADLPNTEIPPEYLSDEGLCRIAIIGRPNVGKSTLVNRLLGEERVLAYDKPGTTRDAIDIPMERDGQRYLLIDTAGIRRQARVREAIEKTSVIQALRAIERCQVAVLMIDAGEGPADQDSTIVSHVLAAGKALVVAMNKWDGLERHQRTEVQRMLDHVLAFVPWAERVPIAALHGSGIGELLKAVHRAQKSALAEFSASEVTEAMQSAFAKAQPPLVQGRTAKFRYAHQGGRNPPRFVVHGNRLSTLPASYQRYLENSLREQFKLRGTPIKFEWKDGENPYAGKKNVLTERQVKRKRRLMRHVRRR